MIFRLLLLASALAAASDVSGSWTGDSTCTGVRPGCKDEHVIWTFQPPDDNNHVRSSADRVTNGERVNMGPANLLLDRESSTLTWKIPAGEWKLTIKNDTIDATLTLTDGQVAKRMKLKKDKP